ncbi:hypothetical protein D3C72_2021770 [compost metagenome]
MRIAQRIGGAQHHKQQRQKQRLIGMGALPHAALPVADDLLCCQIFTARMRPVALNSGELRRLPQMVLDQAILQIELQKLHVAALEVALQAARTEVDQRAQIGIVIQRTRNAELFKLGFERRGKLLCNKMRTQPQCPSQPVQQA